MQSRSAFDGKIPVFAFPSSVEFYLGDPTTRVKLITVYNPYDFAVRFKVLCTTPDKYDVSHPEGKIKPRCLIDLFIKHKSPTPANCNVTDKFRIEMQHHETEQVIGRKVIRATLHSGVPPKEDEEETSSTTLDKAIADWKMSKLNEPFARGDTKAVTKSSTNFLVWVTGVICFICLLLPNEGESGSLQLTVPVNMKLVFSYVLGMVTMVIFRT